ncbi:hypothetical protein B0T22DRAFT_445128 [Podospora appendiculata]|uniref:Uncharacterized protein n=1 Tax=Podospora appendiculata TaxID=314037 RepID=A0AAE0X1U0_9PEZI|nr:hypothetical protein B0T22DRAFT_445128 [Podospora appendiculata]
MASFSSSDCFNEPKPPKPYRDIGGPVVLVGFLGAAWIVVIILVLHYFLAFDPAKDPFSSQEKRGLEHDTDSHTWRPNYVDRVAVRWFSRLSGFGGRPKLESAFTHTGGSRHVRCSALDRDGILFSAYLDLASNLSAYHWQLVVYLAWFANLTHIACLTLLRGYLYEHQRERN